VTESGFLADLPS